VRLHTSFSPAFRPPAGSTCSHKAARGIAIVQLAAERHLGLSTFVSAGNKADVSERSAQ
jgi:acyl-CoA synthetase (NDP forming)